MWGVRRRVVEPGLPAGRWRELAQTLSWESICVTMTAAVLSAAPGILSKIPHDEALWPDVIAESVHVARINCEAKLSQQQRFSFYSFYGPLGCSAARPRHRAPSPLMPAAKLLGGGCGYTWIGGHGEQAARHA